MARVAVPHWYSVWAKNGTSVSSVCGARLDLVLSNSTGLRAQPVSSTISRLNSKTPAERALTERFITADDLASERVNIGQTENIRYQQNHEHREQRSYHTGTGRQLFELLCHLLSFGIAKGRHTGFDVGRIDTLL